MAAKFDWYTAAAECEPPGATEFVYKCACDEDCICVPCYGDDEPIDDNPVVRVTWDGAVFEIYDECLAEDLLRSVFGRGDE